MNDNMPQMKPIEMPKINLDLSTTYNMASTVQRQMDEMNRESMRIAQEAYESRQREIRALEETAANTYETNSQLKTVIDNQNEYIQLLKKQLENDEQQLEILRALFASGEDGVIVEKEIMKIIQEQIDDKHPIWDYVKDKGGDIAVAGVTAGIPVIYTAVKTFLQTKGIMLP